MKNKQNLTFKEDEIDDVMIKMAGTKLMTTTMTMEMAATTKMTNGVKKKERRSRRTAKPPFFFFSFCSPLRGKVEGVIEFEKNQRWLLFFKF